MKFDPEPFKWRAPHHFYIGLMIMLLGWLMAPHELYGWLPNLFYMIGGYIAIDDMIEHTFNKNTPLRLFFLKILVPFLKWLKK